MAIQPHQADSNVSNPVKRARWATQRVTGSAGSRKRISIMNRFHHRRSGSGEKRPEEPGQPHLDGIEEENEDADHSQGDVDSMRRIFFNVPLPEDAKDEEGHPIANFGRNKIRTSKYTPLSFVPKNLWLQFHNIANVYFLFIIILTVYQGHLRFLAAHTDNSRSSQFSEVSMQV